MQTSFLNESSHSNRKPLINVMAMTTVEEMCRPTHRGGAVITRVSQTSDWANGEGSFATRPVPDTSVQDTLGVLKPMVGVTPAMATPFIAVFARFSCCFQRRRARCGRRDNEGLGKVARCAFEKFTAINEYISKDLKAIVKGVEYACDGTIWPQ